MTPRRRLPKIAVLPTPHTSMHGPGSARKAPVDHLDDDTDPGLMTPRGMAAPPSPPSARQAQHDVEASRPATIRIEAYRGPATLSAARPAQPLPPAQATKNADPVPAQRRTGSRLQALMISQGLLLNAFVLLMVFGWSAPLPGRQALLATFALGGIAVAVLMHLALAQARRAVPADARRGSPARAPWRFGWSRLAVRALPAALVTAWVGLGIYGLALPPTANAFQETRPAAVSVPRPVSTPAPARPQVQSVQTPSRESQTTQRRLSYHP